MQKRTQAPTHGTHKSQAQPTPTRKLTPKRGKHMATRKFSQITHEQWLNECLRSVAQSSHFASMALGEIDRHPRFSALLRRYRNERPRSASASRELLDSFGDRSSRGYAVAGAAEHGAASARRVDALRAPLIDRGAAGGRAARGLAAGRASAAHDRHAAFHPHGDGDAASTCAGWKGCFARASNSCSARQRRGCPASLCVVLAALIALPIPWQIFSPDWRSPPSRWACCAMTASPSSLAGSRRLSALPPPPSSLARHGSRRDRRRTWLVRLWPV